MLTLQVLHTTTLLVCTPVGVATFIIPCAPVHTDYRCVCCILLGLRGYAIVRIQRYWGVNVGQRDQWYIDDYESLLLAIPQLSRLITKLMFCRHDNSSSSGMSQKYCGRSYVSWRTRNRGRAIEDAQF